MAMSVALCKATVPSEIALQMHAVPHPQHHTHCDWIERCNDKAAMGLRGVLAAETPLADGQAKCQDRPL